MTRQALRAGGFAAASLAALIASSPAGSATASLERLQGSVVSVASGHGGILVALATAAAPAAPLRVEVPSAAVCRLAAPGLGLGGPAIPCAAVQAGLTVGVLATASARGQAVASRLWVDGAAFASELRAFATGHGLRSVTAASGETAVAPAGAQVHGALATAPGTQAPGVVYGLLNLRDDAMSAIPFGSLVAYRVDMGAAGPAVTGTVALALDGLLWVRGDGGMYAFAYSDATPVRLGGREVGAGFLAPGMTVAVHDGPASGPLAPGGFVVTSIDVSPTTLVGRLVAGRGTGGARAMAVEGMGDRLPLVAASGLAPPRSRAGRLVAVTGAWNGHALVAVSFAPVGATPLRIVTGSVAASGGGRLTLRTARGLQTIRLAASARFAAGAYDATAAVLTVGRPVMVALSGPESSARVVYAAAAARSVHGVVTAIARGRMSVSVDGAILPASLAPGVSVLGGGGGPAVGEELTLTGVADASRFDAVWAVAPPWPEPPVGLPPAPAVYVTGPRLTLAGTVVAERNDLLVLRMADGSLAPVRLSLPLLAVQVGAYAETTYPTAYIHAGDTASVSAYPDPEAQGLALTDQLSVAAYTVTGTVTATTASGVVLRSSQALPAVLGGGTEIAVTLTPATILDDGALQSGEPPGTPITCTGAAAGHSLVAAECH